MFTGLVDDVGTLERIARTSAGLELTVRCGYQDLAEGESVAVNGVCLTVRERSPGSFTTAAMVTTVSVTTVGQWRTGQRVNLERALRAGDRLGGHIVQGHVDGVARAARVERADDALLVDLAVPQELSELMVPRGSITVDGVSLTIAALPANDTVQLSLIEYTQNHTTLGALQAGDMVNVEADVIARHVRRLLAPHKEAWGATQNAR